MLLIESACIVEFDLERQFPVAIATAAASQIGCAGISRGARVAVIAVSVYVVARELIHERRERAVDSRINAVIECGHAG